MGVFTKQVVASAEMVPSFTLHSAQDKVATFSAMHR